MDVKTAFLHGYLDREIYKDQPERFIKSSGKACLLKRSLYDLKQFPHQWNERFNEYVVKIGFKMSMYDAFLYYKFVNDSTMFMQLYWWFIVNEFENITSKFC